MSSQNVHPEAFELVIDNPEPKANFFLASNSDSYIQPTQGSHGTLKNIWLVLFI